MDFKSSVASLTQKERTDYRITNIMMVALLSLVIILTLCFGVRINIGSAVFDDGQDAYVRQNIFQLADVVLSNDMSQKEAIAYVEETNVMLMEKYNILGFDASNPMNIRDDAAFSNLAKFDWLVDELGKDASKINILKYKFAYAVAIGDPDLVEHAQSFDGSRVYSMVGQLVLILVFQLAFLLIAAIMLVFGVLALVKKRRFGKGKLTFMLLLICTFASILLFSSSSFINPGWAPILMMILIFLCAACYALIQHALMEKKDFSKTMFIHNAVLLGGGIIALALFLSPMFRFTALSGAKTTMGWAYLFDYTLSELVYKSAVMSYTLAEVLMLGMLMLPATLMIAFVLLASSRFLAADYQHNEKKIFLIVILAIDFLILLLMGIYSGAGALNITSQYFAVKINVATVVFQILMLAGLVAFEIMYKVRPVKKEMLIK